jgi:hypothetical protein
VQFSQQSYSSKNARRDFPKFTNLTLINEKTPTKSGSNSTHVQLSAVIPELLPPTQS